MNVIKPINVYKGLTGEIMFALYLYGLLMEYAMKIIQNRRRNIW